MGKTVTRAEKNNDWGIMEWLAEGSDLDVSLARMVVHAGCETNTHSHPNCNEVIHVFSGDAEIILDGQIAPLKEGETIVIRAGQTHLISNKGIQSCELIIAYSSGERIYESNFGLQ